MADEPPQAARTVRWPASLMPVRTVWPGFPRPFSRWTSDENGIHHFTRLATFPLNYLSIDHVAYPHPVFSYSFLLFLSMYHMFPGEPDFRPYGISNPARATTTNNSVHTRRNHYDALVRRLGLDARIGLRLRLSRLAIGLPASAGRAARRCVLACRAIF